MLFSDDGIELIKNDIWVEFYHTFLNDPMARSMIQTRMATNEIIEFEGRFGLNILDTNAIVSESEKNQHFIE